MQSVVSQTGAGGDIDLINDPKISTMENACADNVAAALEWCMVKENGNLQPLNLSYGRTGRRSRCIEAVKRKILNIQQLLDTMTIWFRWHCSPIT